MALVNILQVLCLNEIIMASAWSQKVENVSFRSYVFRGGGGVLVVTLEHLQWFTYLQNAKLLQQNRSLLIK